MRSVLREVGDFATFLGGRSRAGTALALAFLVFIGVYCVVLVAALATLLVLHAPMVGVGAAVLYAVAYWLTPKLTR
jgi:hypothetical protein